MHASEVYYNFKTLMKYEGLKKNTKLRAEWYRIGNLLNVEQTYLQNYGY